MEDAKNNRDALHDRLFEIKDKLRLNTLENVPESDFKRVWTKRMFLTRELVKILRELDEIAEEK